MTFLCKIVTSFLVQAFFSVQRCHSMVVKKYATIFMVTLQKKVIETNKRVKYFPQAPVSKQILHIKTLQV